MRIWFQANRDKVIAGAAVAAVVAALFAFYQVFYAHEEPKYRVLERYIDQAYTSRGMNVSTVSCAPRIRFLNAGRTYHLTCSVKFADGSAFNAKGTIISPHSSKGGGGGPVRYRWTRP